MTVLLDAATVTLYDATGGDSHGWKLPPSGAALWTGRGSLQATPGVSDALASAGGGAGPYAPRAGASAVLYLPATAPVADGLVAEVGSQRFYLSASRFVLDPRGTGDLDCWVATATSADDWPA